MHKTLNRGQVYKALGIVGDTIPKDMEGVFTNIYITSRPSFLSRFNGELVHWGDREWRGIITVVKASGAYAKHRIFLHCECGKLVPFGRIGQHKCK